MRHSYLTRLTTNKSGGHGSLYLLMVIPNKHVTGEGANYKVFSDLIYLAVFCSLVDFHTLTYSTKVYQVP